jgi:hypothetical protein
LKVVLVPMGSSRMISGWLAGILSAVEVGRNPAHRHSGMVR